MSSVVRRLVHTACVLLLVSLFLAFLIDLTPGDPARSILGMRATDEQLELLRERLHLNDSLPSRYLQWLGNVATGDFGRSYLTNESVMDQIQQRLPVTLQLAVLSIVMALLISIPIGVLTAYKSDGALDRGWSVVSSGLISSPSFVTALMLVSIMAIKAGLFPATGWVRLTEDPAGNLRHAFLPILTLTLVLIPQYSRVLRADMVSTLQEDYILAARAKGLPTRRILLGHALRPSMFSLVTLAGISLGNLIGGAIIVESLFALPGIGNLIVHSILEKDIPTVQGVVMFVALMYVLINTAIDLLYGYLDPRTRVKAR